MKATVWITSEREWGDGDPPKRVYSWWAEIPELNIIIEQKETYSNWDKAVGGAYYFLDEWFECREDDITEKGEA